MYRRLSNQCKGCTDGNAREVQPEISIVEDRATGKENTMWKK